MKLKNFFSTSGSWFAIKVVLVFVVVEVIAYTFGHFEAETIAIVLLAGAIILFAVAFSHVRRRDKNQKNGFAV